MHRRSILAHLFVCSFNEFIYFLGKLVTTEVDGVKTFSCVPKSEHDSGLNVTAVVAGVLAGVFVLILVFLIFFFATRKRRMRQKEITEIAKRISRTKSFIAPGLTGSRKKGKERSAVPRTLESRCIRILDILGKGNFGEVYKAILSENTNAPGYLVAVKRILSDVASQRAEILEEAVIMNQLHHENIVGLIGVIYDDENLMVVLEYCGKI